VVRTFPHLVANVVSGFFGVWGWVFGPLNCGSKHRYIVCRGFVFIAWNFASGGKSLLACVCLFGRFGVHIEMVKFERVWQCLLSVHALEIFLKVVVLSVFGYNSGMHSKVLH
jgi:hypothetical protein